VAGRAWHDEPVHSRAAFLKLLAAGVLAAPFSACGNRFADTEFTMATGPKEGLWAGFCTALAEEWHRRIGIPMPKLLPTDGPLENVAMLLDGRAAISIEGADIAADSLHEKGRPFLALGRVYDDYLQLVVRADSSIRAVADLRGKRVWTRFAGTTAIPAIPRVLDAAFGPNGMSHVVESGRSITRSFEDLTTGRIDAMFFSGGLPTPGIQAANRKQPMRIVDMSAVLPALQRQYPVYGAATVPSAVYDSPGAPSTLTIPNFLLATKDLPNDLVGELLKAMFAGRHNLTQRLKVAMSLDESAALNTGPVPLHPGAVAYYRAAKP
jgi:hypothetical protein